MDHLFLELPEAIFETSALADRSGEVSIPEITMGADVYCFSDPVRYQLLINNTGGALLVSGSVSGTVTTQCARCLDEVTFPIEAEVEAYFVVPGSDGILTEDEEVEYDQLVEGKKIDLTELCTAALALAFPYIPLCDPDCAGLCTQCGVNRNRETCDCVIEEGIPANNPFAVLKDLKFATGENEQDS